MKIKINKYICINIVSTMILFCFIGLRSSSYSSVMNVLNLKNNLFNEFKYKIETDNFADKIFAYKVIKKILVQNPRRNIVPQDKEQK